MPSNALTIYVGDSFSTKAERELKARLRRVASTNEAAGRVLFRLLVEPDPETWISLLDDCFPDSEVLAGFIVKMIANHPGLSGEVQQAAEEDHRQRIIEAAEALDSIEPANDPITDLHIADPHFNPANVEARLRRRLDKKGE